MTHSTSDLPARVRVSIVRWIQSRMQECTRCRECETEITPFASHCPKCGQANPARVSTSAVVYLAIGFVFVMLMMTLVINVL